jgi:hypothetical protein
MKPPRFRIPLRAVFYKEAGNWIAHGLEFDLVGRGKTKKEALRLLMKAIKLQAEFSHEKNNLNNLFSPADAKYLKMFAAGKRTEIAEGELELDYDSVIIEGVEAREYSKTDAELATA